MSPIQYGWLGILIGVLLASLFGCASVPAREHDVDVPLQAHRFVV